MKLINRNKITRIVAGTAAAFMMAAGIGFASGDAGFSCGGAESVHAATLSELTDALNSYKSILEGIEVSDRYGITSFSIADLNADGMPELICDEDSTPVTIDDFYTYRNGKVVKLNTKKMSIDRSGSYKVSKERKSFCWTRSGPVTQEGNPHDYVEFEIQGDSIVEKGYYYANEKSNGTWDCYKNKTKISKSEFDAFASSFEGISIYQNNNSNRVVQCKPEKYMTATYTWKSDASGWWVVDASGNCVKDKWLEIDGIWYYFKSDGYMAANEWIGGWWCGADGSCTYAGTGSWKSDSKGWWYEDSTGWYPASQWQKIDGSWYYFEASGYIATNKYVDGWWCGADGVCK